MVRSDLSSNKDKLFVPKYNNITEVLVTRGGIYNLISDANFVRVFVRNDSDTDFVLVRYIYVGYVEAYNKVKVY